MLTLLRVRREARAGRSSTALPARPEERAPGGLHFSFRGALLRVVPGHLSLDELLRRGPFCPIYDRRRRLIFNRRWRMIRSQARHRTTPWIAGVGSSSTIRAGKARCVASSLGGTPRRGNVDETIRSLLFEPDHPVPQRPPIHPANLGRLGARGSIKYRRDRQRPPRLRSILRGLASRRTSPAV